MLSDSAFLCAFRGPNNPLIPNNSLENIQCEYPCTPFSLVWNVVNCVKKQRKFDPWKKWWINFHTLPPRGSLNSLLSFWILPLQLHSFIKFTLHCSYISSIIIASPSSSTLSWFFICFFFFSFSFFPFSSSCFFFFLSSFSFFLKSSASLISATPPEMIPIQGWNWIKW